MTRAFSAPREGIRLCPGNALFPICRSSHRTLELRRFFFFCVITHRSISVRNFHAPLKSRVESGRSRVLPA